MESFKNTHLFEYPSEKDKKRMQIGSHKQNKKHFFAINKFNDLFHIKIYAMKKVTDDDQFGGH